MGDPDLIIVERLDTSELTLHRSTCPILERPGLITHPADPFWLPGVDRTCGTCKPEAP